MQSMINADSLQKPPSTAVHSALMSLKQYEITAEELKFKLALIQFFKNKHSQPCITNLLSCTPYLPALEKTLTDRFKYIFSDFYYLSSDTERLNQLAGWRSDKHITLAALIDGVGFLNPENSIDVSWCSSMDDYYSHAFALVCIKQGHLCYAEPEEKSIADDSQTIWFKHA